MSASGLPVCPPYVGNKLAHMHMYVYIHTHNFQFHLIKTKAGYLGSSPNVARKNGSGYLP